MGLRFAVGDLEIHRIVEQETTFLPALEMLPGLTDTARRPCFEYSSAIEWVNDSTAPLLAE